MVNEDFRESLKQDFFNEIANGNGSQCISKFIAKGEENKEVFEYCLNCNCGDLSYKCGGLYCSILSIAESLWGITNPYQEKDRYLYS